MAALRVRLRGNFWPMVYGTVSRRAWCGLIEPGPCGYFEEYEPLTTYLERGKLAINILGVSAPLVHTRLQPHCYNILHAN